MRSGPTNTENGGPRPTSRRTPPDASPPRIPDPVSRGRSPPRGPRFAFSCSSSHHGSGGASIFRTETAGAPYVYREVGGAVPPRPCGRTLEPPEDSAGSPLTISLVDYGCLWKLL